MLVKLVLDHTVNVIKSITNTQKCLVTMITLMVEKSVIMDELCLLVAENAEDGLGENAPMLISFSLKHKSLINAFQQTKNVTVNYYVTHYVRRKSAMKITGKQIRK